MDKMSLENVKEHVPEELTDEPCDCNFEILLTTGFYKHMYIFSGSFFLK